MKPATMNSGRSKILSSSRLLNRFRQISWAWKNRFRSSSIRPKTPLLGVGRRIAEMLLSAFQGNGFDDSRKANSWRQRPVRTRLLQPAGDGFHGLKECAGTDQALGCCQVAVEGAVPAE